ncbi:MAG: hypothetical protein CMJ18_16140 [Phycisphaeraceae bacterium]|nr:hypothetical protein [Phycisphaeraceae bacterium]
MQFTIGWMHDLPMTELTSTARTRPDWLRRGCVAVGNWEPLVFQRRRGTWRTVDEAEIYEREHSEQTVRTLVDLGVNMVITHFYKGYGLRAEAEETEKAVALARRCRAHGIRVGAYVQWGTYHPETLVLEVPDCERWARIDRDGRPALPYGSAQSFRLKACPNRPGVLEYMEQVVAAAVDMVDPDLIHLDNFNLGRLHDACWCDDCRASFEAFVRQAYPPDRYREVFGYPPEATLRRPDLRAPVHEVFRRRIWDPAVRAYLDWHCDVSRRALRRIVDFGRRLKPDVIFDINTGGLNGVNVAGMLGMDSAGLYPLVESFWDEEHCVPRVRPEGGLTSKFRSYKLTRNYDLLQFSYCGNMDHDDRDAGKWLAESLAFNRNVALYVDHYPGSRGFWPATGPGYVRFLREHESLFATRRPVSDIAVVRVETALTPSFDDDWAQQMLAEQYLFERGRAFEILFGSQVERIGACRVILLAGASAVDDAFEAALRQYVNDGGGLVIAGAVGRRDEHQRDRGSNLLDRLLDRRNLPMPCRAAKIGRGLVAHVNQIVPSVPYPQEESFDLGGTYYDAWRLPANAVALDRALAAVAPDGLRFEPDAPHGVVFEYYADDEGHQVHLLDLADRKGLKCTLTCRLDRRPVDARLITRSGETACAISDRSEAVEITIADDQFDTYGILLIRDADGARS